MKRFIKILAFYTECVFGCITMIIQNIIAILIIYYFLDRIHLYKWKKKYNIKYKVLVS